MDLHVGAGGCWFCSQDDEKESLYIEREWDTCVHLSCLRKAASELQDEAQYMLYLLPQEEYQALRLRYEEKNDPKCPTCGKGNLHVGYGLMGGGIGAYIACTCGWFDKTQDSEGVAGEPEKT